MVCSALLPLLSTVCHLCVEISMVYLVNSATHAVANQTINLSTEISLIYWEHNDGLQNYSFKFPSSCFDVWPLAAFQPFNITQNSFPHGADIFPPPPLMKALQIRDRAGSGVFFFFSVAALTTVKRDLFRNELHLPQGRERRIKTAAERKHVTGVSAFSLHVLFLSRVCVISLVFLTISNIPYSRGQIHGNGLRGWFKMMNELWGVFCFCWIYEHILFGKCVASVWLAAAIW